MFSQRLALLFSASALLVHATPAPHYYPPGEGFPGSSSSLGAPIFGATCWGSNSQQNQGPGCGVYAAGQDGSFQQYTNNGASGYWSSNPITYGSYPPQENSPFTACNTNDYGTSEISFYYVIDRGSSGGGQIGFGSNRINDFVTAPMTALGVSVPEGTTVTYLTSATWSEPSSTTGFRNGMVVWWADDSGAVHQFRRRTDLGWNDDGTIGDLNTQGPFVVTMNGRRATLYTSDGQTYRTHDLTQPGGWSRGYGHGIRGVPSGFSGGFSPLNPSTTYFAGISGNGVLEVAQRSPSGWNRISGQADPSSGTVTAVYNAQGSTIVNVFSMSQDGDIQSSQLSRRGRWSRPQSVSSSGFQQYGYGGDRPNW